MGEGKHKMFNIITVIIGIGVFIYFFIFTIKSPEEEKIEEETTEIFSFGNSGDYYQYLTKNEDDALVSNKVEAKDSYIYEVEEMEDTGELVVVEYKTALGQKRLEYHFYLPMGSVEKEFKVKVK